MINLRIYRATLTPVALVMIVAAFAFHDRPAPLSTTLAPDAFDARRAFSELTELSERFPARLPGGADDRALAAHVARTLRDNGFRVHRQRFSSQTPLGRRKLDNVIGVRPGVTSRALAVVVHRDALQAPATAALSATAGLLELARIFGGRTLQHTLILVSTSGGSGGGGVQEFAAHAPAQLEAALVLNDLASRQPRSPLVIPWGSGYGTAPLQLKRTAEASLAAESGAQMSGVSPLVQLARLSSGLTVSEQGPLVAHGLAAVAISASGERGPGAGVEVSQRRLRTFGRASLRTLSALDQAPPMSGQSRSYIVIAHKVIDGWVVALLAGALLLPLVLTLADALARARRRDESVGRWLAWALCAGVPSLVAVLLLKLVTATGLVAATPRLPLPGSALALNGQSAATLVAGALALLVGWRWLWPLLLRRLSLPTAAAASPGAGVALLTVMTAVTACVWLRNPYAALLLLVLVHMWLLAVAAAERPARGAALTLALAGIAPLLLAGAYLMQQFGVGFTQLPLAVTLLVAGGGTGLLGLAALSVLAGCTGSLLTFVIAGGDAKRADRSRLTSTRRWHQIAVNRR